MPGQSTRSPDESLGDILTSAELDPSEMTGISILRRASAVNIDMHLQKKSATVVGTIGR